MIVNTIKNAITLLEDKLLYSKLRKDIIWNYLSLGILAVSGILINVIIAGFYGAETLGVFNQVYAVYIVASQFATGGVQLSVIKHVAEFVEDSEKLNKIISSATVLAFILGIATGSIVFLSKDFIGNLLASPGVAKGLFFVAPALVFFSLNKVLIMALNGLRRMKAFAFCLAVRYLLMIGYVVLATFLSLPGHTLSAAFLVAESLLFMILLIIININMSFVHWTRWDNWLRTHAIFGFKGFFSGILVELNTRVDILMLGFFLSDKSVGIYTLAAMVAEGLYQALIVIRSNVDPILVRLISEKKFDEIKSLVRKTQKILYPAMAAVILCVIGLFPFGVELIEVNTVFIESWPVVAILSVGILISSGYIPFNGIMIQAGLPEYHTLLTILAVGSNIVLNTIMIPLWGIKGAAIATGSSFVLSVIYLNIMVKRQLKFSLR